MKVALLGANGFIGSRFVEQCVLGRWAELSAVVRRVPAAATCRRFDLECHVADGMDLEALTGALRGCDVVIHAAAGDERFVRSSPAIVYRAAERAGAARLVYLSSMAVHGWSSGPGTDEGSSLRANHEVAYNNWKVHAERSLLQQARQGKVRISILRPGIVWGPRSAWVVDFVRDLSSGQAQILDDGHAVCNAIYVDNLNWALWRTIERSSDVDEVFLVGDPQPASWRALYEPLASALKIAWSDVPQALPNKPRKTFRDRYVTWRDAPATQRLLKYVPVRLRYTLSQAADAWITNPLAHDRSTRDSLPVRVRELSLEQYELQRCRYRFPLDRARAALGDTSLVPIDEALRRTIGWLQMAGYVPS